ncbi:CDP-alcohol phosphatidyltransferase family protein [Nitrosococcus oceani]|uniref:CDP-alcohol phosphatidyltransferase family protein n=1 Tax=Nitrosococcus oceani TaxID=1229 RepID=UPI0018CE613D|nr:CDP-alcohol phosphatidyltransferase family protein [Nitrosococcus oceani]
MKPVFQKMLRPVVKLLARAGVTANVVTLTAAALSFTVGACIALWPYATWPMLLLPGFLFLRMALNAIDGMLAREYHQASASGAILNELGDVLSDAVLYLPLALVSVFNAAWMVVIVVLAVITEMAGVVAVQVGSKRRYDGPMGKSDRALVFGVLGLWLGLGGPAGCWIIYLQIAVTVLMVVTIYRRARGALAEAEST